MAVAGKRARARARADLRMLHVDLAAAVTAKERVGRAALNVESGERAKLHEARGHEAGGVVLLLLLLLLLL